MNGAPQAILYSGTNFTGESCELPMDHQTYSLSATGLDKIASIKMPREIPGISWRVTLYTSRPTQQVDTEGDNTLGRWTEDVSDTGEFAGAVCVMGDAPSSGPDLREGMRSGVGLMGGFRGGVGRREEREILETIG
ncbi:hypothetical protein ACIO3O_08420 [Streptomyces sp. NPDC087440]|uniref:hypothetical protein n=1 Tax=Streptomyces sp. NPDC087440 TaxID=3365790 RepID=UPI0038120956